MKSYSDMFYAFSALFIIVILSGTTQSSYPTIYEDKAHLPSESII
jgi:hypothetical protein